MWYLETEANFRYTSSLDSMKTNFKAVDGAIKLSPSSCKKWKLHKTLQSKLTASPEISSQCYLIQTNTTPHLLSL